MVHVPKLSRRARWAVPAGVLVIVGGVLAGSLISVAQAAPGLPARTPAQLLVQVADSAAPPLTGTVVETASFGLPRLPGNQDPTSLASLLTGSHTVRVWYSGPRRFRLAVPEHGELGHRVLAARRPRDPRVTAGARADAAAGSPAGAGRGREDHRGERGPQRRGGRPGRL